MREEFDNNGYIGGANARQRDFVLNMNEFAHILSKTDGSIKCAVGPFQTSLSQQEVPVIFNTKTKRFEECNNYDEAKQLFVSAPEGWYITLKNPTADGQHPQSGRPNQSPTNMEIGKKVNIVGPTSFALFPGQMAKTIQGHRLRHNQYLLARVYDVDAANNNEGITSNAKEDKDVAKDLATKKHFPGELLVIKGTEISFYIPPTGIEVIPVTGTGNVYVREAVTLERLEYCILKNEDGNKRYVNGPAVVFPSPTETFIKNEDGDVHYKAIELSKISGIYVKVIAEYTDTVNGKQVTHPVGEELFITGNEQMIYFPRPEHAIIYYDNKYMHHAIAIPAGEGRYIMNRETGEIKTIIGPRMYLPDPRKEVVVKRKLTQKECELWYPGNKEVLIYNTGLDNSSKDYIYKAADIFSTENSNIAFMSCVNPTVDSINRGNKFSEPRSITFDNKFDGAVCINVWTGYAVNIISKSGKRTVLTGPATKLLDYDETLESLSLSTGRPKTTDNLISTVYLRVENNKISDLINAQTKDFVNVAIKVSYCVDFLEEYKDKWFSVENYIKYLCDRIRSLVKREIKKYEIEEFYNNSTDIIRDIVLNISHDKITKTNEDKPEKKHKDGRLFKENGMFLHDVEVLSINMDTYIERMLAEHQNEIIKKNVELSASEKTFETNKKIEEYKMSEIRLNNQNKLEQNSLNEKYRLAQISTENKIQEAELKQIAEKQEKQAEIKKRGADLNAIYETVQTKIFTEEQNRNNIRVEAALKKEREETEIEKDRQTTYANNIKSVIESISPELTAALTSKANSELVVEAAKHMSPLAIANGESVADTLNTLLRGTTLEKFITAKQ